MISATGQITGVQYADSAAAESKGVEVNDEFIAALTEKFLNDDIPDAYQDQYGKELSSLKTSILGFDTGNVITGDDLNKSIKRDFSGFSTMLNTALSEAGISKDPSFEVKMSSSGRLYIDSDHPDKEAIEKILNDTRNIRDTFSRMSANSSLVAALKRGAAFNDAYNIDPESAVQRYSYLFNEKPCDIFSIFVSEDEYRPSLISYGIDEKLEVFDDIMSAVSEGDSEPVME